MILIVGLGNPGPRYAETRHNVGFMAVDAFARKHTSAASGRVVAFGKRFEGRYAEVEHAGSRVGLLEPETFMNASGLSVRAASDELGVTPSELIVVHDELDIAFGEIRLKSGGGDGGHRGLRSISAELGTPSYARVRLGIGRPPLQFDGDVADFVLQAFALEARTELDNALLRTCEALESFITEGLERTMNRTNQRTVR